MDMIARKKKIMIDQPKLLTATGGIVNFDTNMSAPLKQCKMEFKPIQDLHGYDSPWPAGGGKNLLPCLLSTIKTGNTTGAWTDNTYSVRGVEFKFSEQDGYVTSIEVSGTATANATVRIYANSTGLSANNYIVNGCPSGGTSSTYYLRLYNVNSSSGGTAKYDYGNGVSVDDTYTIKRVNVTVESGATVSGLIFKPMVRLSSVADATFASYSNICPITGWTGLTGYKTGKNLLDYTEKSTLSETRVSLGSRYGHYDVPLTAGTYTLAIGYNSSSSYNVYCRGQSYSTGVKIASASTMQAPYVQTITFTLENSESYYFWLYLMQGAQRDNVAWFTLVKGSEPLIPTTFPVTFPAVGKNLFDPAPRSLDHGVSSVLNSDGSVSFSGTANGTAYPLSNDGVLLGAGNYVWSITGFPSEMSMAWTKDGSWGGMVSNGAVITLTKDTVVGAYVYITSGTTVDTTITVQLESGSTPTAYEPYTNTLYGGHVDLVSGKVWKTHQLINLNPANIYTGTDLAFWYTAGIQGLNVANEGVFCNRLKLVNNVSGKETYSCIVWYANNIIRWVEIGKMDMTLTDYRAYLQENPLTVTYKLTEPVLVGTLAPQQIKSLKGTNNIFSDVNGDVTVQYWKH